MPPSVRNMPPTSRAYPKDAQSRNVISDGFDCRTKKRYGSRTTQKRRNRLRERDLPVSCGITAIILAYQSQMETITKKLKAKSPMFVPRSN